jgi:hypothetical protein
MSKNKATWTVNADKMLALFILLVLALSTSFSVFGLPTGIDIVSNTTEQPDATPATSLTTAGGTFTTLILNGTFQNPRWKAYVGNISGMLTLDNAAGHSIYDWNLTTITGEVYISRNSSISWTTIGCSTPARISAEHAFLHHTYSSVDNINNTFNMTIHKGFYVSTTQIANSTCRSIATYVNDAKQAANENAAFQEILLTDNTNLVYTTLLENNRAGFDNALYDFQMIVPEDDTITTPTTYYFYAEIS